ncbi:tetratricopeptide repeat protein [Roseivirga sp. UBA1976]|uniref:tetratricopeptide repeat protein n=1 Tax=Roseivirga sp. UBA1976 TaxID=1947386 RepID=UPI00257D9F44|nr:tetratricopeptide repeat protein [Roseivirga sp. UBA1976]MEC7753149.1 tetratricopeptide repeat protein [Bacteroidota bacterium]|tara:strand:- start:3776 stop:5515 length:1740 start_codon:yes stop_codon:yes gene_type:complete
MSLREQIVKQINKLLFLALIWILSAFSLKAWQVESTLKKETSKYDQANAEYLLIEAQKYFLLEDYERAIAFLDKSIDVDEKNHAAWFKKAEIYLAKNDTKKGVEAIQKAIALSSNNKYYYVLAAELEKANRNPEGAARYYELMASYTPDYQVYLVELANVFQAVGKTREAIELFRKQESLTLDQSMKLVEMLMQSSKEKEAITLMEQLVIDYPLDMDIKYQYANVLSSSGQQTEAIQFLENQTSMNAAMRLLLSDLYASQGQSDAKFQLLTRSFNDPNASLSDKVLLLGQLLLENSSQPPVGLIDSLQTALENQYPNEPLAIENGAYVYTKLAEQTSGPQRALFRTKSIEKYQQLKDLKPGDFKVWDKVLTHAYENENWKQLNIDAEEALSLFPNQAIFYIYLASAKIELNELDEASDLLGQATRMTRANTLLKSQILAKQAQIAFLNGQTETADSLLKEAVSLEEVHPDALKQNGEILLSRVEKNAAPVSEKSAELKKVKESAEKLYANGQYNQALITLLHYIHTFEDLNDGATLELFGDTYFQIKLNALAVKYWKMAKELGGGSEKLDQKIASGQIN